MTSHASAVEVRDHAAPSVAASPRGTAAARDIDRYTLLSSLQERNAQLFYQTMIANIEQLLPLIYTPTVGEACREFSRIAREPKGF